MVSHAKVQIQKQKTKQRLLNHQKANSYIDVLVQILLRSIFERIVLAQNQKKATTSSQFIHVLLKTNPWLFTYIMFLLLCGGFLQRMGKTIYSTKRCRSIASFSFKFTNNNPTCIETLDFVVVWWQTTRGRITGILWQQLLSINSGWFQQTYFMIWKKN